MVTNNALADKFGGIERYVADLSAALVRRGVGVRVVAKRWDAGTPARVVQDDGVVVERHRVPSKRNPLYALLYAAYVGVGVTARTRPRPIGQRAIIHAHMGLPAWPLAVTRRRYLLTFHAPVWRELLGERQGTYRLPAPMQDAAVSTLRRVEGLVASRSAGTVVLSEFMRRELSELSVTAARGAELIPGAIDADRFCPADRTARAPDRAPTLFTARRLTPRTGVDDLIRALVIIRSSFPETRLQIAGVGAMHEQLRSLTRSLGLQNAVDFLGRISDEELVEHYRNADLVVMPTRELEGFGLTTAEALACGTVVVGTPVGATPELLRPLDPSLVTRDASPVAIAGTVVLLLGDRDRLSSLRDRARACVVPVMTWDTVVERYLETYERVAGSG